MAMILDTFMSKFNKILVQMVQEEVGMLLDVPGEIEKLQQTVAGIQCVIADAEMKQTQSTAIKHWLMQLKDVMYDADDVIDLCQIKAKERLDHTDHPSSSKKSCRFLHLFSCFHNPAFAHEIGTKIKEINLRLQGIAKSKAELGLIDIPTIVGPPTIHRVDSSIKRKTDSLVVMEDIVGEKIKEDVGLLVSWLTDKENGVRGDFGVVAIVGMGGIGKTTLAKRIFNDSKIGKNFELKIWAYVSKNLKAVELLKCTIREAGGEHGAAQERSELVPLLQSLVQGKRFLLVLDDVWKESRAVWDELLSTPMRSGARESRLLITTRNQNVANYMNAAKSHPVKKLSDENGWALLVKQVFPNDDEHKIKEFKDIGIQLAKKCDGLPLAIKSIGGVLRTKDRRPREWQALLRSNIWSMDGLSDDFHQAFYLSYEDLPSHLKQCFILCSLYPEDTRLNYHILIYHWFGEGSLQGTENPWELGIKYYNELLLRNFLEAEVGYYDQSASKMHDILWSFAHHLGKDENYILTKEEVLNRQGYSTKLRRLSIQGGKMSLNVVKKEKGLRTLLIGDITENALSDLCTVLINLRILNLHFCSISTLPEALCSLVHLKYLNVSDSKIRTIPESIGYLINLVYLNCLGCKELRHVPRSITKLKRLVYLNFSGAAIEGIPEEIPPGFNILEKLINLYGFPCGKTSMLELENLSHLVGLELCGLDKVPNENTAKRAKLQDKYQLKDLALTYARRCCREDYESLTNEKKVAIESVLNELCPPSSLEKLTIDRYFGSYLPNWLNFGSLFPNLRYLAILNCHSFVRLAPLGQLPYLDALHIVGAYSMVTIGGEFFWGDFRGTDPKAGSCSNIVPAFSRLTVLKFEGLVNWKEWQWNETELAMPNLNELGIISCPRLKSLPRGLSHHATSLEHLEIIGTDNLTTVENFPSIKRLFVSNNSKLERISNIPRASHITIKECQNLKTVERLDSLQQMLLSDSEMDILPEYLKTIMPQYWLGIHCSTMLLTKITRDKENSSERHKIQHIPEVTIRSDEFYVTYHRTH